MRQLATKRLLALVRMKTSIGPPPPAEPSNPISSHAKLSSIAVAKLGAAMKKYASGTKFEI
jgi:hypothetical protein